MIRLVLGLAGLTPAITGERRVVTLGSFLVWIAVGLLVGLFAAVVVDTVKMMLAVRRSHREQKELEKKLDSLLEDFDKAVRELGGE